MPHFDEYGRDTVICQVCADIVSCNEATWRTDITGSQSAGNICQMCLKNYEREHELDPQKDFLEGRFTELLGEAIEINCINRGYDGEYNAFIVYDGTNNKANKGHIYFKCRPINNKVEDLRITSITGSNYFNPEMVRNAIKDD